MRSPAGAYGHHRFAVLSRGLSHEVSVAYYENQPFMLPEELQRDVLELQAYWLKESPELKDFSSIVHLRSAAADVGVIGLAYVPTTYFQFLFSNYSLDISLSGGELRERAYMRAMLDEFLEKVDVGGVFRWEYQFPRLGNSLGITVSVVTSDNQLIVTRRSSTAKGLARDKGNWLCAVGTQIKRHQPRFLTEQSVPTPLLSAQEGLKDEMGVEIAATCSELVCRGLVYRWDFHHCEILYETLSSLSARDLVKVWQETGVPDRREIEEVRGMDISSPQLLLSHLAARNHSWSPQHAAGVLHSLAARFPGSIQAVTGLDLRS